MPQTDNPPNSQDPLWIERWIIPANLINIVASIKVVSMASESLSHHGGENYAKLALFIIGMPLLILQLVILLPLNACYIQSMNPHAAIRQIVWLYFLSLLPPVVTVLALAAVLIRT